MVNRRWLLLLSLWFVAACQGPTIADGALACGSDGSCPDGFECAADNRCYRYAGQCGDGNMDPGETCDPAGVCPDSCSDGNACTRDELVGSQEQCNTKCERSNVSACVDGDGCCPAECNKDSDNDCLATCGNAAMDPGETCDESAGVACVAGCNDGDACTMDQQVGSASNCNLACSFLPITSCKSDDGCCPTGCVNGTDNDCPLTCGDGQLDPGEFCDPPGSCPQTVADCNDMIACTFDSLQGSAVNCNARCTHTAITMCGGMQSDGCCPAGCDGNTDVDCGVVADTCGNGVLDPGETCDPASNKPDEKCPTSCPSMACMTATLSGNRDTCDVQCTYSPVTSCTSGDGCCGVSCSGTISGAWAGGLSMQFQDSDCL